MSGSRRPCPSTTPSLRRRLRQRRALGPGRRHLRAASTPGPSASARATAWACGWAAGSRRWSTGSRRSSRPAASSSSAPGAASRRSTTSAFEPTRDRHPDRLHGRHPPAGLLRLVAPFAGRRLRRDRRATRATACSGRSTHASPVGRLNRRAGWHRGRDRRLRDQRADRRLRACADEHRVTGCSSAIAEPGGHVKTVDGRRARRPGPGRHRLHRLQRAHLPAASSGLLAELGVETQPSDMSFGSACDACGVAFSSRGARGFFADAGTRSSDRPLADVRGRPPLLPRRPRRRSTARSPTARRSATGSTSGGYGRGVPRPLPRPDHVGRLVDGRRRGSSTFPVDYLLRFLDNHGLIGFGNAPQWRVDPRRVDGATSAPGRRRSAGGLPSARASRSSPWSATRPASRSGPPRRRRDRFDAVVMATHADDALRPAGRRRRIASGRVLGRLRVLDATGSSCTPTTSVLPATRAAGRRGTSTTADCRRPGDALTMTYHMNRLQSLPGPVEYCVSVNPGDRDPAGPRDPRADVQPPDVHVPDARGAGRRRARCRASAAPGTPAPTSATGSTRTAAAPASRRRALDPGSRRRAWRHEVAPARGQRPPPARPAVHLRARARRLVLRRSISTSSTRSTGASRLFGRNRRAACCRSATRDHLPEPAADLPRESAPTCAPRARTRRAGG